MKKLVGRSKFTSEQLQSAMDYASVVAREANCPRASVGSTVFDGKGVNRGSAANRKAGSMPMACNCNDGADSSVMGSSTCQAAHSEMLALQQAGFHYNLEGIAVTRPPCRACLNVLLHTDIWLIVTDTSQWPDRDGSKERWIAEGGEWQEMKNPST